MSSNFISPWLRGVSALSVVSACAATPVQAQDAAANSGRGNVALEEIVVTGEKVDRDLKNTASSVTVITGREIDKKTGDSSVAQVINGLPNVAFTDTVSMPIIRGQDSQGPLTGQNSFWGGTVPRATINLDGRYLNYNESYFGATSAWDVSSIEVFRGPQTTSQGANAIAGSIIVNTKDPTFTPEGAYQAEIGNYNTKRTSVAVSGPLIKDQLAARIAIDYAARDTFIDYVNPNFVHNGTDQNFSALNARAKLLWVPTEITGLETKFTYSHNGSNRPSQEAASAPFDRLQHVTTTMPTWFQETDTGMLDIKYDMGNGIRFFNQSQYTSTNAQRRVGLRPVNGDADVAQKNVSNEARVSFGDLTNVLSGFGGVYYAHTKTDEKLVLAPSGLSTFDDTKENLGLFTEMSYRFAPLWTLTGGLRFQQDHIQRIGKSSLATVPVNYDQTFTAFLPKVSLAYAVTPDWTVGALVSRGYNPGGVSLNLSTTPARWTNFEEETLWNYELFTRSNFLNNRLSVNGNLFYMDFKNAQYYIPVVISTGVTQSYVINAEKAHAYGLEVGLDYRVVDSVTLKASAGLLRTEIDRISSNIAYQGNEFAKSPGYMLSFGASWDATDKLNLSGQVRHTDGYYSDVANTKLYVINAYTVADARISYQFDPKAQVYGYVKNIFDERAPTYMQQNRGIGGIEASMIEPRMFGIGVKGVF